MPSECWLDLLTWSGCWRPGGACGEIAATPPAPSAAVDLPVDAPWQAAAGRRPGGTGRDRAPMAPAALPHASGAVEGMS